MAYCNGRSQKEGLTPAYKIEGDVVTWDRSANGYRLPTEAEWEYACRAGTATPFYLPDGPGDGDANYYGHYPYQIEENYFSQGKLKVKPGEYRQRTLPVGSFAPNPWGLYDMHGNVGEWVWDGYGPYDAAMRRDPAGAPDGRRVYRGGGWNDFGKNLRSAYRATLDMDKSTFNLGFRVALNAAAGNGLVANVGQADKAAAPAGRKILIACFSWAGNTLGIAREIQRQTGGDLFEIAPATPYSQDYNTVLKEAQRDQKAQARPPLAAHVADIAGYDTVLLGYPNWWASIPMPIASFLEEYDFSGKTIVPFCSHGGGRLGQSVTAIAKLAPAANLGEGLSVHYGGGASLGRDIAAWLGRNNVVGK